MTDKPLPVFRRTLTGFVPASEEAQAFFERVKQGALVTLEGKQPRNLAHHRKFWKLMSVVADNHDRFDTAEKVCLAIKYLTGHGEFIPVRGGSGTIFSPGSINFAKMDQTTFDAFYDDAVRVICAHIIPGMDADELADAVETFA